MRVQKLTSSGSDLIAGTDRTIALSRQFAPENPSQRRDYVLLPVCRMKGVWRFQDLVAWQLADELRQLAIRYLAKDGLRRDFKLRDQLSDAASSAPKNIAEGFGRKSHKEFAHFCHIARGSEEEVIDSLIEAHQKHYISAAELDHGDHAARKALKVLNGLIAYLESTPNWPKE